MSFKAVRFYLVQLFIILFLTACSSGSSEDTGNTVTGTSGRIFLAVLNANNAKVSTIEAGDLVTAQVKLTNTNGLPVSGNQVSFTASSGTLSAVSRLTNADGVADVVFNSSGLSPSVITITASTTYNGEALSITSQFEINEGVSPTISLSMVQNGAATNRISEGESAQVNVKVVSETNTPITDTLVTFTAGIGTLSPTTALTDSSGEATVTLSSAVGAVGASEITAAVTINEQTTTSRFAYEIQPLQSAVLSLAVVDKNGAEVTSITEGNILTLNASLVGTNGVAIPQEAINFTASSGTFSASSRLTGSTGLATVSFDSSNLTAGVVTVTAASNYNNNSLTVSKQFEVLQALGASTNPNIAISFKKDGSSTNRIQADETAQLGVLLRSENGDPIANAIVSFTADLGALNAPSALTNNNGVAEVTLSGNAGQLGAGRATASTTINNITITDSLPYEVVDSDVVTDTTLKLGYLDDSGNFQPGIKSKLTNSNAQSTISAGGTLGLELGVFDQDNNLYTPPLTVTFTSTCVTATTATLDTNVTTINGKATTTFEDIRCATAFGNEDTVVATVTVNSTNLTATHSLKIQPERLGSIEFVSATPQSIVIKGTGGQGSQETSTLTFLVKGELGNALAQQNVDFSLNTEIGGLTLAASSGVTNSQGLVSAKVISGTVPTAVRVTAKVTINSADSITTQSDLLSVNTGLPDQNSMTLAFAQINPEARNIAGTLVQVTAFLADSFNNPVPDGTTVNFTAESGSISSSCNTTNGQCSVNWKSQEPYEDNNRVTILATAIGHESFVDVNGNNLFDTADGIASNLLASQRVSAGFDRAPSLNTGFIDMSEAWVDNNENRVFDAGEQFIDSVTEGASLNKFDAADGKFNGPQCAGNLCAPEGQRSIVVRKAAVLIAASSRAHYKISATVGGFVYARNYDTTTNSDISIARGGEIGISIEASDTARQTLPVGTTISIAATGATLIGQSTLTVANTVGTTDPSGFGGLTIPIRLVNELTEADTGELNVVITSPSGVVTQAAIVLKLL